MITYTLSRFASFIALALLMLAFSSQAKAAANDCTLAGSPSTPSSPGITVDVPRDLPVGTTIPGSRIHINWNIDCKTTAITAAGSWGADLLPEANGTTAVAGLTNVYTKSSWPSGVGFRFVDASNNALPFGAVGALWNAFKLGDATVGQTSFRWNGAIELVKTSATSTSGTVSINFILQAASSSSTMAWGNGTQANSTLHPTWTISRPALTTCTVINKDQMVAMPRISASAINNLAGRTPFVISLNCSAGSTLYMTMTDAVRPSNDSGYLSIDSSGSNSSCTTGAGFCYGIGIVYVPATGNSFALGFGPDSSAAGNKNQFRIGSTPNGMLNLNFYAWYAKSNASKPFPIGAITGKATFTLSYQ